MLLSNEQVFKKEVKSVGEFAKALSVSGSAIYTALVNGKIDYCIIAGHKMIVLTRLTKAYKPNESPRRVKPIIKRGKNKPTPTHGARALKILKGK
jgi:hypothetical protein